MILYKPYEPKDFRQLYTTLEAHLDMHEDDLGHIDYETLIYDIYLASQKVYRSTFSKGEDTPKALSKSSFYKEILYDFPDCLPDSLLYRSLQYARKILDFFQPREQNVADIGIVLNHLKSEYAKSGNVFIEHTAMYIEGKDDLIQDYSDSEPYREIPMYVFLRNPVYAEQGVTHGLWCELPATKEIMDALFKAIDLHPRGDCRIMTGDVRFADSFEFMQSIWPNDMDTMLDTLNYLAVRLSELTEADISKLKAVAEWGHCSTPIDALRVINNLDAFDYEKSIETVYDVGQVRVQNIIGKGDIVLLIDAANTYMNRNSIGEDFLAEGNGRLVESGYIGTTEPGIINGIMEAEILVPPEACITPMDREEKSKEDADDIPAIRAGAAASDIHCFASIQG